MKKILLLLTAALVFSCAPKDPKETLKDDCEKLLLSQLNDPKSYEFVSFEVDTFKTSVVKQRIKDLEALKKKYTDSKDDVMAETIGNQLEVTKAQLPEMGKGDMQFKYTFRAKNAMNALVLDSKTVISDSKYNFKDME